MGASHCPRLFSMKNTKSLLAFLFAANCFATNLAHHNSWIKLLRYKEKFSGYESEVTNSQYFISKTGRFDPIQELKSTRSSLLEKEFSEEHAICKFPARAKLLQRYENLVLPFSIDKCSKFKKFQDKINLESVSLIFSSYFIQKPASAFGHTFFRLKTSDNKTDNDLLDYGVDFSAQVTTANPIIYGVKGIFGGFKGKYKLMPFYSKVREYNDMESRDLWDYELNFNKDELDFFTAHLYEMQNVDFDYYYFDENCSYHILSFIDAIKPNWNLTDSLSSFVPPIDTVYALFNDSSRSIVVKKKFRPSKYKILQKHIEQFTEKDKQMFKSLREEELAPEDITKLDIAEDSKVKLLDSYSDYIEYKYANDIAIRSSNYSHLLRKKLAINLERSSLVKSRSLEYEYSSEYGNSPDQGHKSKRVSGFIYHRKDEVSNDFGLDLEYRFTLHDYLQRSIGYIPFATSEIMKILVSINEDEILRLKRLTLANVEALRPVNDLENSLSWRFQLGIKDLIKTKNQEFAGFLDLSLGYSFLLREKILAFFLRSENIIHNSFDNSNTLSLGPELLFIINKGKFSGKLNVGHLYTTGDEFNKKNFVKLESRYNYSLNDSVAVKVERNSRENTLISLGFLKSF